MLLFLRKDCYFFMNTEIETMNLEDLEIIKDHLTEDYDNFWNFDILKEELQSSNSKYLVAKIDKKIVGFAGIKIILDEADIMNIVTKKTFRKQGIRNLTFEKFNHFMYKFKFKIYFSRS